MGKVKEADPSIWQIGRASSSAPSPSNGFNTVQIVDYVEERENPLWQISLIKPKKMPKGLKLHEGLCSSCNNNSKQLIADTVKYHPFLQPTNLENMCIDCYIWQNRQAAYKNHAVLVVSKYCYYIGNEATTYSKRGYGGRRFRLKFRNGQTVTTTNLVPLGKVPNNLLATMPNNANFV